MALVAFLPEAVSEGLTPDQFKVFPNSRGNQGRAALIEEAEKR